MRLGLGLGLGGRGGFSVPDIGAPGYYANVRAWWDASDASTITDVAGSVSQIDDKSGNGFHLVQGTGAAQPLTGATTENGRNALTFTTNQDMAVGSALGGTNVDIWTVFRSSDASGGILHSATVAAAGFSLTMRNGDTNTVLYSNFGTPTIQKNDLSVTPANRAEAYTAFINGELVLLGLLGANISTWADFYYNAYTSDFGLAHTFCEMVVGDAESPENRAAYSAALMSKWGIASYPGALLLETGDFLLLESGDKILFEGG